MPGTDVSLGDKYDLSKSRIFLNGTQAIVRLTMMQQARDKHEGHNTAGYVSGYRGSPLGGLDQQFVRAAQVLKPHNVVFQPGLNEDMAATALWGTQQAGMRGEGAYDGVFGIWYGKGPGVDRCGDVFRHANHAGTARLGGVLVLMGDDHTAESSTVAHQSEFILMDVMMPILNPAGVQELLDYGLYGIALSRYSGCWVGLKCVKDTIESTAIADGNPDRLKIVEPDDFKMPDGGLNIRPNDERLDQEARMHEYKRFAATAFARANKLDKIVLAGGKKPKLGIVTTGKSYLDVRQALDELGIDETLAAKLGIRLYKVAMTWPLEPDGVERFTRGLDLVMVVEEKRSLIETQIREQLYERKRRPAIIGKKDENGATLFPAKGALSPNRIAIAIAERILRFHKNARVSRERDRLEAAERRISNRPDANQRIPYFCAGCPHNSSTVVPDGGRAYAGIGCHWMVQYVPGRATEGATHMGGEGANWIGEAPFSTRSHVFQNIGDGTYNHSGILPIRAAIAADVNMTFKILYNDAVAMTGGQPHEGNLTVPMIARQVAAEGAKRVVIVSDEPDKYAAGEEFPANTGFYHRDDINQVQSELQNTAGVTVLIYDQTCAAEKRRRRKRGLFPDPPKRVFINERVCEGCGDCGVVSNCVAIAPLDTDFGRKRQIDQSSCNKDYSCLKGFCPSFVTIEGGELRKGVGAASGSDAPAPLFAVLPEPGLPALERPYGVLVTGIGGTGVVTVAQVLGMAAHLEGKGAGIIDMAGLSQKNGTVASHLKIAAHPEDIKSIRVAAGAADLVLGCDIMGTGADDALNTVSEKRTRLVVNDFETMPAPFAQDRDYEFPSRTLRLAIEARAGTSHVDFVDATGLSTRLLGDAIATNMFMLGFAWQRGLVPLTREAIDQAIALNGVSVDMNQQAFLWGRRAAHDLKAVAKIAFGASSGAAPGAAKPSLDQVIRDRVAWLTDYRNAAYGERYRQLVSRVAAAEKERAPGRKGLAEAVARNYFKLLAIKDEYEVARLYTDGVFERAVAATFTGDYKVAYHLAPPILGRRDAQTGHLRKTRFGPWMKRAFGVLASLKGLRGTVFDIFGYSAERRAERTLLKEYEETVDEILSALSPAHHKTALELLSLPEKIRGFGHVKAQSMAAAAGTRASLLERFRALNAVEKAVA